MRTPAVAVLPAALMLWAQGAVASSPSLTPATRTKVIEGALKALHEAYVFPELRARRVEGSAFMNHGFERVERLPGNVGYARRMALEKLLQKPRHPRHQKALQTALEELAAPPVSPGR